MIKCHCLIPPPTHTHTQMHFIGAIAIGSEIFGQVSSPMVLSRIECKGNELSLLECNSSNDRLSLQTCDLHEDAGVVCQGKNVIGSIYVHSIVMV